MMTTVVLYLWIAFFVATALYGLARIVRWIYEVIDNHLYWRKALKDDLCKSRRE
jgi:hypothetical protein